MISRSTGACRSRNRPASKLWLRPCASNATTQKLARIFETARRASCPRCALRKYGWCGPDWDRHPAACRRSTSTPDCRECAEADDVGEPGNILEDQRVLGEEAGDHQRERCILGARDRDSSVQTLATNDPDPIHVAPASLQNARRSDVGTATPWVQAFPTQANTFAGELRRKSGAEKPPI